MSYNLNILVSDIAANLEVNLATHNYFEVGNIPDLQQKMLDLIGNNISENTCQKILNDSYNWDKIAIQTLSVYKSLI
jgi:D-hexose-6-phosphate mutarotase